jgi:hypothetical protein
MMRGLVVSMGYLIRSQQYRVQDCLAIETSSLAAHASRESFNHRRSYVHCAILDLEMGHRYIQEWKNSHG